MAGKQLKDVKYSGITFASAHIVDANIVGHCMFQGLHMRIHQICNMDVVSYACSILCLIVLPMHLPIPFLT